MSVFCRAVLNYLPSNGALGAPVPVEVAIHDGRRADLPGWTECGFELVAHPSAVSDWADDDDVTSVHYREIEDLARKMAGSDVALVSSHIRRSPEEARRHHQLSPITLVHSDFAAGYDETIRRNFHQGGDDAPALRRNGITVSDVDRASRIVILQFWRNLGPARMDFPLGFCDARTVRREDGLPFHVSDYAGSGSEFDAIGVAAPSPPDQHRWYAFPGLEVDETVAFRTYDTEMVDGNETYFTPHSAFRDPSVEVGRPARSSIELRATCLWL